MKIFPRNKWIDLLIKLVILGLLAWVIYRQVFLEESWMAIVDQFQTSRDPYAWLFLAGCIILIPVNWGLETKKWRSLLPKDFGLSFWACLKAVLLGVSISLLTPNRIGEYGGRILLVKGRKRWEAVLATLVGSMAQLLVLLGGGIFGLSVYGGKYLGWTTKQQNLALIGVVLIVLAGLYIFFNIARFELPLRRLARRIKWAKYLLRIGEYSSQKLLTGLIWAFLRYSTYVIQYLLVLYFFGVDPPVLEGLAAVATIYLIQTSVPLPPLMAILARGELAILIWSAYSANTAAILASSLSLFILNLSVPALLGAVILVQINVLKSIGYESSK